MDCYECKNNMSDLDDKLKGLELGRDDLESVNWGYVRLSDEQIAQIKRVLRGAGYTRVLNESGQRYNHIVASDQPVMTGQEWYSRFMDGLHPTAYTYQEHGDTVVAVRYELDNVLEAAKKAAGIE